MEARFVLLDDRAFTLLEDVVEVGHGEFVEDDTDGQAANELRLETKLDQILRRRLPQQIGARNLTAKFRAEADLRLAQPRTGDVFEFVERAADDEENVPGGNGLPQ